VSLACLLAAACLALSIPRLAATTRSVPRRAPATRAMATDASTAAATIVSRAEAFVKTELAEMDGSHDWWHIARVRKTALSLATEAGLATWECVSLSRCYVG